MKINSIHFSPMFKDSNVIVRFVKMDQYIYFRLIVFLYTGGLKTVVSDCPRYSCNYTRQKGIERSCIHREIATGKSFDFPFSLMEYCMQMEQLRR